MASNNPAAQSNGQELCPIDKCQDWEKAGHSPQSSKRAKQ